MFESISNSTILAQEPAPSVPFYLQGWFVFLLLVAAVALGWFLSKIVTGSLKLSEYAGRMSIVLIALFVALLMIWSKWPPALGVDLRGGINIIGSLNLNDWDPGNTDRNAPKAEDIIKVLVQRVNPGGTKEIMIRPLGTDKIEVTIPSVDPQEADSIWNQLVKTGKLEFRILANPEYSARQIDLAREMAAAGERRNTVRDQEGDIVATWVSLARVVQDGSKPNANKAAPFKFVPGFQNLVRDKGTGKILDLGQVPFAGDSDDRGKQLAQWCEKTGVRTPQVLVLHPDEDRNAEGSDLYDARSGIDETGRGSINFTMTSTGARKMRRLTSANINRPMGIVLDNQLHSAPNINDAISRRGQITGEFTPDEVTELVTNLKSGKLDVALNNAPISRDFIESTLGAELKEKGIWAIGASLVLVLIFMMFYYRFAGIVATIALMLNLVLILALVMAINQPLTLTGLAGLVLTVGMSVDANVLIFERIREELDRGAALRMAIRNGFDKATTTIVDANVTTLITALVLYIIGTEQIKGFSVTLILGILMSMFTAIYVSRLIFDIFERKRWLSKLSMTRILDNNKWNFLNKVGLTSVMSIALIAVGIAGILVLGPRILNHDLRGGSTVRMEFLAEQDVDEIKAELVAKGFEHNGEKVEFTVSGFGGQNDPELANKVFKVDSNLPAFEGGVDEDGKPKEKFPELEDRIRETFGDRLKLHHVEIEGVSLESPSTNDTDSNVGMRWRAMPVSPTASLTSLLTYQESESESQDESQTSQESQSTTDPETSDDETATNENAQDSASSTTQESGGDFPANNAPTNFRADETKVTRTLKVSPKISGKSLHALLIETSEELGKKLEEDQIVVDTPDVVDGESASTTISEDWTVTMSLANQNESDEILQAWAKKFNQQPYFPTSSKVGGQIAGQAQQQAFAAIITSLLGIIAYVWIRFQNVAFGLAAVVALIHDVLIVLGAIAISHWLAGALGFLGIIEFKISLEIVAALLTVIGYSLNDTIVVFDRVREVRGKRTEITADIVNTSISQTLSRTILTSLTTFIVVFILYWFGGEAIHGFAFALVIGVLVGTYSSIFVACPTLLWLMNTVGLNPGEVDVATE